MPAKTKRQRQFFGAELARKRAGQKTQTGLSEKKLRDFAKAKPPRKSVRSSRVRRHRG
jgi:hypothetical protein